MNMEHAPLFNLCMCTTRLRMVEKGYSFSKMQKNRKKCLSRWTIQEKKSPELESPTTYLGLIVLEATGLLQPLTGSGTGPPVSSSL